MNFPRYWMIPACLLLTIAGAGCGSSSSFFMIRNPFQDEANAIADLKARSKLKQSATDSRPDREFESLPETTPPDPRRSSYFGQETLREPGTPLSPEKERPSQPAVPLSRQETVTTPRPAATGAVCYRCNGKGRHLNSLTADGRLVECTDCSGTGRR